MNKQFTTYEIALKLKELGFNEPCLGFFALTDENGNSIFQLSKNPHYDTSDDGVTSCPLWQQIIDWFRDAHNLEVGVGYCFFATKNKKKYQTIIISNNYLSYDCSGSYDTYQEARESAILKAIELYNIARKLEETAKDLRTIADQDVEKALTQTEIQTPNPTMEEKIIQYLDQLPSFNKYGMVKIQDIAKHTGYVPEPKFKDDKLKKLIEDHYHIQMYWSMEQGELIKKRYPTQY